MRVNPVSKRRKWRYRRRQKAVSSSRVLTGCRRSKGHLCVKSADELNGHGNGQPQTLRAETASTSEPRVGAPAGLTPGRTTI